MPQEENKKIPEEKRKDGGIRTDDTFYPGFSSKAEAQGELNRRRGYYKGGVACQTIPKEINKRTSEKNRG